MVRQIPAAPDRWFTQLAPGRTLCVDIAGYDEVAAELDPLPADAPALLACHVGAMDTASHIVEAILDELEVAAVQLFPIWLPGGDDIDGRSLPDVRAVRALARRLAAGTRHFGPFLADLAEAAVRGTRTEPGRFARETRAAGLARVLADSYRRPHAALVVTAPTGLPDGDQQALAASCEWLAGHGRMGMALAASAIPEVDRFATVTVRSRSPRMVEESPPTRVAPEEVRLRYPAPAGRPHPGSAAEKKLAAALADCGWAHGGLWNTHYHPHPLRAPIRADLLWPDARCAVEVDGDDHRAPAKYAADRQRDVQLQLDGYAVLRFTNEQVLGDVRSVVAAIERCVRGRRRETETTMSVMTEGGAQ